VRLSTGGRTLRIRLTNEYGTEPVTIGAVHVALANGSGGIVAGSDHVVTFSGGGGSVTVPTAAPAVSDPIPFPVSGLTSLAISLYVPDSENPGGATPHSLGQQTAYIVPGDQTGAATLTGAERTTSRFLLSGVEVLKGVLAATIVTLGDSITDGFASTVDANHRYPDYLAQRLQGRVAVANEGISGNRVLSEGIGPNAQSRFDRDVLSRPGVRYVILLEGINDIGLPNVRPNAGPEPSADQIIAGYRQLIARSHELGVLILGGTLTPYQGAGYYTDAGEAIREAVNAFVRTSGRVRRRRRFRCGRARPRESPAVPARLRQWRPPASERRGIRQNGRLR
jgi:lysophospholipase L1-like esterase